jgi:hypothetical protein
MQGFQDKLESRGLSENDKVTESSEAAKSYSARGRWRMNGVNPSPAQPYLLITEKALPGSAFFEISLVLI